MTQKPFFCAIKTCEESNEKNIFRYWEDNNKYNISDFLIKKMYIFILFFIIPINIYLVCKSIKDIFKKITI